jgi:hypothetical protein
MSSVWRVRKLRLSAASFHRTGLWYYCALLRLVSDVICYINIINNNFTRKAMKIPLLLLGIITIVCPELKSEVCGYARFYRPDTQATIDILFDAHIKHPTNQLFPLEAKFDQILSTINESGGEEVDLVWEYPEDETLIFEAIQKGKRAFLAEYPFQIKQNFRNINFIAADSSRQRYVGKGGATEGRALDFNEPVPFGDEKRRLMCERAGATVLNNYLALYSQVVEALRQNAFTVAKAGSPYDSGLILDERCYNQIGDLEMLYHILVSEKKRIIVYCGAWHAVHIATFLEGNHYSKLQSKRPTGSQMTEFFAKQAKPQITDLQGLDVPTLAQLEFLYGSGRAMWDWMRREGDERASEIQSQVDMQPSAAEALPLSPEHEPFNIEKKRNFLSAQLMVSLPDSLPLVEAYRSVIPSFVGDVLRGSPYRIALGAFEIYFDKMAIFARKYVVESLKEALEVAMRRVLDERGASLSLPFLHFCVKDGFLEAEYGTSAELCSILAQIEQLFNESEAVKDLTRKGHLAAVRHGQEMPIVRIAQLPDGPADTQIDAPSAVVPLAIDKSINVEVVMQWHQLPSQS